MLYQFTKPNTLLCYIGNLSLLCSACSRAFLDGSCPADRLVLLSRLLDSLLTKLLHSNPDQSPKRVHRVISGVVQIFVRDTEIVKNHTEATALVPLSPDLVQGLTVEDTGDAVYVG